MPPTDPEDELAGTNPEEDDPNVDEFSEEEPEEEFIDDQRIPTGYRLDMLERQARGIEIILALTISALIILALGVNWYLFKQTRMARGQVHQQRIYVNNIQKAFDKRSATIKQFITSLESYAKTNPDFQRILDKHRKGLGKYYSTRADDSTDSTPTSE